MKTLIASSASLTAVLASYFSINTTFQTLAETFSITHDTEIVSNFGAFCPIDRSAMTRNLEEEGVISKIEMQTIKTSIFVNIEDKTNPAE